MSSILSRCRLSISKRGYQSRAPTTIKRVMFYSSLQAAVSNSICSNINFKVKQVVCLEAIYRGRDVVAVLPTGCGKSMIFHLLPSLFWWQHFTLSCRLSSDKNTLSRPSHQRFSCHPPNSGGHVTRPNQGLSSLALGGRERETLGTRLASRTSVTLLNSSQS